MTAKNSKDTAAKKTATAAALTNPDDWAQVLTTLAELSGGTTRKNGSRAKTAAKDAPVLQPRPRGSALLWRAYRRQLAPLGWMIDANSTAWLAYATADLAHGQVRALTVTLAIAAAAARAAWNAWRSGNPDGSKGRPKRTRDGNGRKNLPWALSRSYLLTCLAAGAGWFTLAAWHPVGPRGITQVAWLAGGLLLAAPHMHYRRYRPLPAAAPELLPGPDPAPGEDERLTRFRRWINRKAGPMANAALHDFGDVPDGFTFQMLLHDESDGTREAVVAARKGVAKLYDVPEDQVSIEQAKKRSEGRARITVLTTENALERVQTWNGVSTYNPRKGWFDLGLFLDSRDTHWQLHKPDSGSYGGVVAGVIGAGKTGTTHVIACEAGQAKLCAVCGPAGSCGQCQTERICALWMGDPQMQGFSVWRGFADVCAWGPEGCVQMLQWGHAVMRRRAAWLGQLEWTDHLGRANKGKGWFDPAVGLPIIYIIIDEWPIIAANPDLARIAVPLAAQIAKEGRKAGVSMLFLTQIPDLTELGERAVREMLKAANVISHRTDGLSKFMLGIEGNPQELPAGVHGLGFTNGVDARPAATFRTKHIREFRKPWEEGGVDVREIAERISRDPMYYDPPVLDVIGPLGYTGPGHVLDGAGCDFGGDGAALASLADLAGITGIPGMPAVPGMPPAPRPALPPAPLVAGPASLDALGRVARALDAAGAGGADMFDVMTATKLDALEAQRATAALVAQGHVTRDQDGRFTPARQK
jgi:hypothetical protein